MVMDMKLLIGLIISFPLFSTWVLAEYVHQSRGEIEKEILKEIYHVSKFHTFIRPERPSNGTHDLDSLTDGPVDVHVTMYVLNIDVDTTKQEYNIQMYFRQEWNDTRLAYNGRGKVDFLSSHDATGLWTPDLFFVNEKSGHFHAITRPNIFLRIYPDGRLLYSQRLSMTLSCPMNLQRFPFDKQICQMPVESYGYTMNDIVIQWKPEPEPEPVGGVTSTVGFNVAYYPSNSVVYLGGNRYSRLLLEIHLTRLPFGHLFHIYMPIILLVFMSWITFWMNAESLIPRLTTAIISTVCTLLQLYSNGHLFASVCYPTSLDVWCVVSCLCIFVALFENIYVSCDRKNKDAGITVSPESGILNAAGTKLLENKKEDGETQITVLKLLVTKLSHRLRTIDVAARIFLPAFFVLFNIIYFTKVILLSDNEPFPKGI